jgi:hypothetical protein
MSENKLVLVRAGRGHRDLDAAHADPHQHADLEQLEADGAAGRAGELRVLESKTPQCADEHISQCSKPQPQLIGAHRGGRGAVGKQIELAFLDAVLHLAAGAIDFLVEMAGLVLGTRQGGDDKARVGLAAGPHSAFATTRRWLTSVVRILLCSRCNPGS